MRVADNRFAVRNLPPGDYVLRVTTYDGGGAVTGTVDSTSVTVAGPETGYAAAGAFSLTL